VTTLKTAAETALDLGHEVKQSMVSFGRSAGRKIDEVRDETGGALHRAASSVRKSSARIDGLARGAAKGLDATASFVKNCDLKTVSVGLRRFGRNHLTGTVLTAAAIGFVAGFALSRDRSG
jgi:ElaB/YqjD/DUF883 family membrane-anchored ribosome-binding protein